MQIFHRSTNVLARASLVLLLLAFCGGWFAAAAIDRSPWVTREDEVRDQPVPFSHEHHVAGLGLDCRYCHSSVEESAFAGMPSPATCMGCHAEIWKEAPVLDPVRRAARDDETLAWTRVDDLPDFVFFDHSIHVARGVGCESCHGRVDRMPLTRQAESLKMSFCLECHRQPNASLRPRDAVFVMGWTPPAGETPSEVGARIAREEHVRSATSCSTCHR